MPDEKIVDNHLALLRLVSAESLNLKEFWKEFFTTQIKSIFEKGGLIVDIGGGLRIDALRGNKVNKESHELFFEYTKKQNVQYKVTDYTDKYSPDFVEDVHALSFKDSSVDSIICIALLEHVYDPKLATEEMLRVVKPGGAAFIYAPFIYRYHAHTTDYHDYFRYSKDGWAYLLRNFSSVTICPVRGLFESLLRFTPLHYISIFRILCRFMDTCCKKMRLISSVQTSGYYIVAIK